MDVLEHVDAPQYLLWSSSVSAGKSYSQGAVSPHYQLVTEMKGHILLTSRVLTSDVFFYHLIDVPGYSPYNMGLWKNAFFRCFSSRGCIEGRECQLFFFSSASFTPRSSLSILLGKLN